MHIFGSHTNSNGGIEMTVHRAKAAGLDGLQVFTAIPKFYNDKSGISDARVKRFRAALDETGLDPKHVMVHAGYVLNTAKTGDAERRERAHQGLAKEMERSSELGVAGVCFHPGSAGDGDVDEAIGHVSDAITRALEAVDSDTELWIENTAGAGATVGRTSAEVARMLDGVPSELRHRTGYGLDTCHLFSAGYAIDESEETLRRILDEWEEVVGEPPRFFHLNDSRHERGTNKDRHALIGEGHIGEEPFRWLLADERSQDVLLVLETPQANPDVADDDRSADPNDVAMRELLERLAG
jgi:deoxyribonuclease-4